MNTTKYVVIKDDFELPFIFSHLITHIDFAKRMPGIVVSAGFCHINKKGKFEVSGKSISLGCSSRPSDAELLNKFLIG